MKTYIKFFGSHGVGKTTLIRELSKILTGTQCDYWENTSIPPIVAYNHCDCNKFAAIGTWKYGTIRNGMDPLHQNQKYHTLKKYKNNKEKLVFNYKEKIENGLIDKNICADVIFEDGVVTYSPGIQTSLDSKFDFYTFHLEYPYDICLKNYINRGSEVKEGITSVNIERKIKEAKSVFDKIQVKNKYILSGTMEENINRVLEITDIKPCLCMKDKIICDKVNNNIRRSLFED